MQQEQPQYNIYPFVERQMQQKIPQYNIYPFVEGQMLKVCTGVGKSLQGVRQIERRGEIVAVCAEDGVNHRQILRVVLRLQRAITSSAPTTAVLMTRFISTATLSLSNK